MRARFGIAEFLMLASLLALTAAAAASDAPHITRAQWEGRNLVLNFDTPMLTLPGRTAIPTIWIEPAYNCQWGSWSDDTSFSCSPAEIAAAAAWRHTPAHQC